MIKKSIVLLSVCLLAIAGSAWALTPVLDTGDPNERVCNPKSYTDLGNGIVRDNVTGLEWQKEAAPGECTWQQAINYCNSLSLGGHLDWRMPTIEELLALYSNLTYLHPIDPLFFTNWSCWSSTTVAGSTDTVWWADFEVGYIDKRSKTSPALVSIFAVRGKQYGSLDNLVINGDGTVTDPNTGLMWQQCNAGQAWNGTECTGSAATRSNWDQAVAYVQELNDTHYLGYEDWRLPTKNELQSLIDYSRYNPATTFPNTVASAYGSSTRYMGRYAMYFVDFSTGSVDASWTDNYVRAVRAGHCLACIDDNDCDESEICQNLQCVAKCINASDCDDGLFCTGVKTCVSELCVAGTNPCISQDLLCNEDVDQCVECFDDSDCPVGKECSDGQCVAQTCTEHRNCPAGFGCVEGTCTVEAPPVITAGPFLAAGSWPVLPRSEATAIVLDQNYTVLWSFTDDYATCDGVCSHRARYQKIGDTAWKYLAPQTDGTGKKYAYVELPVDRMVDGHYRFVFDLFDCAGQLKTSKVYYFNVAH